MFIDLIESGNFQFQQEFVKNAKFGNSAFLLNQMPQAKFCVLLRKKGKVKGHTSQRLKWSELIAVSVV